MCIRDRPIAKEGAFMGRCTGVEFNQVIVGRCFFWVRYNSEGRYIDSLPDLNHERAEHACTTFVTSQGEEVDIGKLVFVGRQWSKKPVSGSFSGGWKWENVGKHGKDDGDLPPVHSNLD